MTPNQSSLLIEAVDAAYRAKARLALLVEMANSKLAFDSPLSVEGLAMMLCDVLKDVDDAHSAANRLHREKRGEPAPEPGERLATAGKSGGVGAARMGGRTVASPI